MAIINPEDVDGPSGGSREATHEEMCEVIAQKHNRIRELEDQVKGGDARLMERITELEAELKQEQAALQTAVDRAVDFEAENAVLKRVIEINKCGRSAIEARDKKIAALREALGAADEELKKAEDINTVTIREVNFGPAYLKQIGIARAQITAALGKGE